MPKPNYCLNCGVFIMATTLTETPDKVTCSHCWHVTYKNPVPVVVALIRVVAQQAEGLLLVKRKPSGKLALPGGFMSSGDGSLGHAISREVREETGHILDADGWTVSGAASSSTSNTVLIFMEHKAVIPMETLRLDVPENPETSGLAVALTPDEPLAFPLHQLALADWFEKHREL